MFPLLKTLTRVSTIWTFSNGSSRSPLVGERLRALPVLACWRSSHPTKRTRMQMQGLAAARDSRTAPKRLPTDTNSLTHSLSVSLFVFPFIILSPHFFFSLRPTVTTRTRLHLALLHLSLFTGLKLLYIGFRSLIFLFAEIAPCSSINYSLLDSFEIDNPSL